MARNTRPARSARLRSAALAAIVLAGSWGLAGCYVDVLSGEEPRIEAPPSSTVDPFPDALPVGATHEGKVVTTVIAIEHGGADTWPAAGEGYDWLWVNARVCVPVSGATTEIGWYQWAATAADGGWYPADVDYAAPRPTNQLPRLVDLVPGDCREGRVLIPVPDDAEVVAVVNADRSGEPQSVWRYDDTDEGE